MKAVRCLFFAIGSIFFLSAAVSAFTSNLHAGIIFTFAASALYILAGAFASKLPKWVSCAALILTAVAAVVISSLYICGCCDTVSYDEDAVIVLGCGIRGDVPAPQLARRLDAAAEYYRKNPDVLIIVSGGQGEDEDIPESEAMKKYLLSLGIPESSISEESSSTSTEENFRFSKEVLDARFEGEPGVAFITSEYHIFRASLHAKSAGFDDIAHLHSGTPWNLIIPNGIRECLGIVRQFVFGWL